MNSFKPPRKSFTRSNPSTFIHISLAVTLMLFLASQTLAVAFAAATVGVTKSVSPGPYEIGGTFSYKLQYSCASLTDTHCDNMIITDQLPAELNFIGGTAGVHPATFSESSGLVTVAFTDPVPAGATGEVTIQVQIPIDTGLEPGDVLQNIATGSADNAPPADSNPVDITIAQGEPAYYGKYATGNAALDTDYTFNIETGPVGAPVSNLIITDTLPTGTLYVGCTDSCTYDATTHTVVWNLGTITSYEAVQVTVQFPSSTFTNTDNVPNVATFTFDEFSTSVTDDDDHWVTIAEPEGQLNITKWGFLGTDPFGSNVVNVGQEAVYPYYFTNGGTGTLSNIVVTDNFPVGFDFSRFWTVRWANNTPAAPTGYTISYEINNSGTWVTIPNTAYTNGAPDPFLKEEITLAEMGVSSPDKVTGLRWEFATLPANLDTWGNGEIYGTITNLSAATQENCIEGSADTDLGNTSTDTGCGDLEIVFPEIAALESYKWVTGTVGITNTINTDVCQLTSDGYTRYPCAAITTPGGIADYRLILENPGTIDMTNIVMYDIFPYVGDTGVLVNAPRNSQWEPVLAGPVTAPAGVTVYYSQSTNPCRPELDSAGPAGCVNDWTTVLPADPTTVDSIKLDFGSLIMKPADQYTIEWPMRAPVSAPTNNEIAWNSFGYGADRADTGESLLPSEPPKVGVLVQPAAPASYGDTVWFDANQDGIQDPTEVGIDGVQVQLYLDNGDGISDPATDTLVNTTITSGGGQYLFPNLPAGDYFAVFYPPTNYDISPTDVAATTDALDSDGVPSTFNGLDIAITPVTTLDELEHDPTWDLGLYPSELAAVGNYVWNDTNADGTQNEPASSGLNGVTVNLLDASGAIISTTTTTNDAFGNPGYYLFDDLPPGTYSIDVVPPAGAIVTTQGPAGSSDPTDSDIDPVTGETEQFTLAAGDVDLTWDAGIIMPTGNVGLGNYIWLDADNNGIQDGGEQGIDTVVVNLYVDTDGDGVFTPGVDQFFATTTTFTNAGAPGYYEFTDLPDGDYIVQIDPANFGAGGPLASLDSSTGNGIGPDPDTNAADDDDNGEPLAGYGVVSPAITLAEGTESADGDSDDDFNPSVDFGFYPLGSIGDYVWIDANGDGVQDASESPIPGVVIELEMPDGTIITTTTNSNGLYLFPDLPPGNYIITVDTTTLPAGMAQTYDADGLGTPNESTYSLGLGEDNRDQDFGYEPTPLGSIGDTIWGDDNSSGGDQTTMATDGESGLAGVVVALEQPDGTVITTTTSITGFYIFSDLPFGTYTVTVDTSTLPAGYASTPTYDADGGTDSTSVTTIDAATPDDMEQDFSYPPQELGSIGDTVWLDLDGDGVIDPTESGIGGVVIELEMPDGTIITTTTSPTGTYLFPDLPAGTYTVTVDFTTLPSGLTQTYDFDGLTTPHTSTTTIGTGEDDLDQDFGYQPPLGSIGDTIWGDDNSSGGDQSTMATDGESGLAGVVVALEQPDGTVITTTTSITGFYVFSDLPFGTYTVTVDTGTLPAGYASTPTYDADGGTDSTSVTTIDATMPDDMEQDFSYPPTTVPPVPVGSIGDTIWGDDNSSGGDQTTMATDGESGLAGVVVALEQPDGTVITTTTSITGFYVFSDLPFGTYTVTVDTSTLPAGYSSAPTYDADGGIDSMSVTTIDATMPDDMEQDFSYPPTVLGSIGDTVWLDLDGDGVIDPSESGIGGVVIELEMPDGTIITTTTSSTGTYLFPDLPAGTYTITVDVTTLPAGLTQTYDFDGIGTANTSTTTIGAGENDLDQDFGYQPPLGSIGDTIWGDDNSSGGDQTTMATDGESGLVGVVVELEMSDGTVITTTTDSSGNYLFSNLPYGTYTVTVDTSTLPAGYSSTPTYDADGGTDSTSVTTIDATTPDDLDQDFSYPPEEVGSIGDTVWLDVNGDGVQDPSEIGIGGVVVELEMPDGTIITTTTSPTGIYGFPNLPAGIYTVTVDVSTLPAPYTQSYDADGLASPNQSVYDLGSGEDNVTQDFGYSPEATAVGLSGSSASNSTVVILGILSGGVLLMALWYFAMHRRTQEDGSIYDSAE